MNLTKRDSYKALFLAVALAAMSLVGCQGDDSPNDGSPNDASQGDTSDVQREDVYNGEFSPAPGTNSPFTPELTTKLRESFSWQDTDAVAEKDAEGRPTIYYTLVLNREDEQYDFFGDVGYPFDDLPYFGAELTGWDELPVGTSIDFLGDSHGVFGFAILPGEAYNVLREEALKAETPLDAPFEVILFRDAPKPFRTDVVGRLDFDALDEAGFTFPEPNGDQ